MMAHAGEVISREELHTQLNAGTAPLIIDVRSRWEYHRGHVPGAVSIPFWTLLFHRGVLPATLDKPMVVYCEHGPRAGIARFALRQAGFQKVRCLAGHMAQWRKAKLPIAGPVR
jgi:rhodanese-related sulfurtransferase